MTRTSSPRPRRPRRTRVFDAAVACVLGGVALWIAGILAYGLV